MNLTGFRPKKQLGPSERDSLERARES